MTNFEGYQAQVIGWIAEWSKRSSSTLSSQTCINCGFLNGLGVDGGDAEELVEFLYQKSGVSFGEFSFVRYFGPELSVAAVIFRPRAIFQWFVGPKLTIGEIALYMYGKLPKGASES
jgi:hypothetical protein